MIPADREMKRKLSFMAPILAVLFLLAMVPIQESRYQDILNLIMDVLHFPSAVLLTIFLVLLFQLLFQSQTIFPALTTALLLLVIIELVQPIFGRTSDVSDFILGGFGVVYGVVWSFQRSRRRARNGVIKFIILLLFILYSILQMYIASLYFNNKPRGFNFEQPFALSQWRNLNHIQKPALKIENNVQQGEGRLVQGRPINYQWSGMTYQNSLGIDLSDIKAMTLDYFHNGDQPTKLRLRIDDSKQQTFRAESRYVRFGWNQVVFELPFDDFTDFRSNEIIKIGLFTDSKNINDFYLVDNIYFKTNQ